MSKNKQASTGANKGCVERGKESPLSLGCAQKGVKTGADFANLMSALMSDLITGRITPSVGNATCNAGGKLLKVVELQYKYGTKGRGQEKTLLLAIPTPTEA